MDCEMGETTEDEHAVIGIGVADDEGDTVIDELIKPPHKLLDVRTEITGFKLSDFKGAPLHSFKLGPPFMQIRLHRPQR